MQKNKMKAIQVLENYGYPLKNVETEMSKFSKLLDQEAEFISANIEVERNEEESSKPFPKSIVRALVLLNLQDDGLHVVVFEDKEKEPTSVLGRKSMKYEKLEIRTIDNAYYLDTYFRSYKPTKAESAAEYASKIESRKKDAKFCAATLSQYASISDKFKDEIDRVLIQSDYTSELEKLIPNFEKSDNVEELKKVVQIFNDRKEVYSTLKPGSPFIDYVHTIYKGSSIADFENSNDSPEAKMWVEAGEFATILNEYSKNSTVHFREVKSLLDSQSVLEFLDRLPSIAQKITDKEALRTIAKTVFMRESRYFISLIKFRCTLTNIGQSVI